MLTGAERDTVCVAWCVGGIRGLGIKAYFFEGSPYCMLCMVALVGIYAMILFRSSHQKLASKLSWRRTSASQE